MKTHRKKVFLIIVVVLLLGLSLFQFFQYRSGPIENSYSDLLQRIPSRSETWVITDLPIGETESVSEATVDILESDNILHREYKNSEVFFHLFLVHWSSSNRILPRQIAFHSPDHCWTRAGFIKKQAKNNFNINESGLNLLPGNYREFSFNGSEIYVLYWQLFGDETLSYMSSDEIVPSDLSMLDDFFTGRAFKAREQYFVRLSSNVSIEKLKMIPMFNDVLQSLSPIRISLDQ